MASILRTDINASAKASPKTVSQNPTNTETMETRPKARGPRMGAWIANTATAKTCENTVLVVTQEVGDRPANNFFNGASGEPDYSALATISAGRATRAASIPASCAPESTLALHPT